MPVPEFVFGILFLMNIVTGENNASSMLFNSMEECEAASAEVAEQVRALPDEIVMHVECRKSTELTHPRADA